MTDEDSSLVEGLKAKRLESFERLVQLYAPKLLAVASRIGDPADAEDAVQESLLSAWQSIDGFEGSSSLYTWLHRLVVNRCLARMRLSRYKFERAATGWPASMEHAVPAWSQPPLPLEKEIAMRRTIEAALAQIPEDLRIVMLLRDVEGLSSKETAEQLAISDALVRQRLHRARTGMAELLRPELCAGPGLTCGGQLELLFDHLDGTLAAELKVEVAAHVEECTACAKLAEIYRGSISLPQQTLASAVAVMPADFPARTMQRLMGTV